MSEQLQGCGARTSSGRLFQLIVVQILPRERFLLLRDVVVRHFPVSSRLSLVSSVAYLIGRRERTTQNDFSCVREYKTASRDDSIPKFFVLRVFIVAAIFLRMHRLVLSASPSAYR